MAAIESITQQFRDIAAKFNRQGVEPRQVRCYWFDEPTDQHKLKEDNETPGLFLYYADLVRMKTLAYWLKLSGLDHSSLIVYAADGFPCLVVRLEPNYQARKIVIVTDSMFSLDDNL